MTIACEPIGAGMQAIDVTVLVVLIIAFVTQMRTLGRVRCEGVAAGRRLVLAGIAIYAGRLIYSLFSYGDFYASVPALFAVFLWALGTLLINYHTHIKE